MVLKKYFTICCKKHYTYAICATGVVFISSNTAKKLKFIPKKDYTTYWYHRKNIFLKNKDSIIVTETRGPLIQRSAMTHDFCRSMSTIEGACFNFIFQRLRCHNYAQRHAHWMTPARWGNYSRHCAPTTFLTISMDNNATSFNIFRCKSTVQCVGVICCVTNAKKKVPPWQSEKQEK